ncbi:MAG: DUF3857 domain-containing protein [Bdellovibrionaceae bacterium]|nr:DUF3857 domain-containing protein [Pseudobdellovibrionaceae bacterium]
MKLRLWAGSLLLLPSLAAARPANFDEVPVLFKNVRRETRVAADGTSRDKWLWHIRLQRQDARESVGSRAIRFYRNFESVRIIKAGSRTEGRWRALTDQDIQERGVTDDNPGFSSLTEMVLNFPDVQEGSEIEFEYEISTRTALEPGFWGQSFVLDSGAYRAFSWSVRAETPLFQALQDPTGAFEVKTASGGRELSFSARKPFSLALADEDDAHLGHHRQVILLASFLSDWKVYGQHSAKEFDKRLEGRLSKGDEDFARSLRKEKDPDRRIQKVLTRMHGKLRYFGDWRASEQMYVPRSLAEITRTLSGDCKDFALVAIKMLKLAGLEAKPVVILNSEESPGDFLYRIPTDNVFNHVIIRVTDGERSWWVDPTNPAARVNFLSDEIAGRPALVLDSAGSSLLPVRAIAPEDYRTLSVAEVIGEKDGVSKVRMATRYEGFNPVAAGEQVKTDGLRSYVEQHVQRLMPQASLLDVKVDDVDMARDTGDLRGYTATAQFENFWVRSSAGPGFSPVREDVIERFRNLPLKDRGGDILLGKVYTYRESFILKGFRLQGETDLDCQVRSPWMDFEQKVVSDRTGLIYQSVFSLKRPELRLNGETLPQARRLQKDLRACAGRQLFLLRAI